MGLRHDVIHRFNVDPTINDDGTVLEGTAPKYKLGDDWLNEVSGDIFEVFDLTAGAAVWTNRTQASKGIVSGPTIIGATATLTTATLVANVNDYDPAGFRVGGKIVKTYLSMSASGANRRITGLVPSSPVEASIVYIHNEGPTNILPRNNDALSVATNRFDIGSNRSIQSKETLGFIYNTVTLRWNLLAGQI